MTNEHGIVTARGNNVKCKMSRVMASTASQNFRNDSALASPLQIVVCNTNAKNAFKFIPVRLAFCCCLLCVNVINSSLFIHLFTSFYLALQSFRDVNDS